MVILKDLLLAALVAVHVVGSAFLFRRFFPRESPWLAFLLPGIVAVLLCNFVEYQVPLTALQFFLPLMMVISIAAIAMPGRPWRVMRLPTWIFLGGFAFALILRMFRPDLNYSRDGIPDLGLIANFMFGQTLPVESTWLPPVKLIHYYCLEQYGASVLTRLMGIDIGTGFNFSVILLSTFTYFLAGAIAWHLSRGKLWITILMVIVTACSVTGVAGYFWLTVPDVDQVNVIDLDTHAGDRANGNFILRQLIPTGDYYSSHELLPPGYGGWMGCLHSAQTGQMFLCFSILTLAELVRRRRSNWPWIALALGPFLMLTSCTWALPMVLVITAGGLVICWKRKIGPQNGGFVLAVSGGLIVLMEPMLSYFFDWVPSAQITWNTGMHTQIAEFLGQWWPVFLPWVGLLFVWKHVHPSTRVILIMTPLAFAGIETWNYGERLDATGKFWGCIYIAAWVTFLPEVARRKGWPWRCILALIVVASFLSLCFWINFYREHTSWDDFAHLDGLGPLRTDSRKARILETVSRLDNQVIVPGKSDWAYCESALLPLLTHNRAYVAWSITSDTILYTNGNGEAHRREVEVNQIYAGKNDNPLLYLRQRNIAAFVIYPDDHIDPAVVDQLKQTLAPYYTYEDANDRTDDDVQKGLSPQRPCAGVFLYRPEINTFLDPFRGRDAKRAAPKPQF